MPYIIIVCYSLYRTKTYFTSKFNGNYVRHVRMCLSMCIYMVFFLRSFLYNSNRFAMCFILCRLYLLSSTFSALPTQTERRQRKKKTSQTLFNICNILIFLFAFFFLFRCLWSSVTQKFRMRTEHVQENERCNEMICDGFRCTNIRSKEKYEQNLKFTPTDARLSFLFFFIFFALHFISRMCWMVRCIIWIPQLFDCNETLTLD